MKFELEKNHVTQILWQNANVYKENKLFIFCNEMYCAVLH